MYELGYSLLSYPYITAKLHIAMFTNQKYPSYKKLWPRLVEKVWNEEDGQSLCRNAIDHVNNDDPGQIFLIILLIVKSEIPTKKHPSCKKL